MGARRMRHMMSDLLWGVHRWVYRRSSGRLGGRIVGMPVLLLTTTGRRTGRPRTVALTYLPDGGNFVVIASNGGARRHPDWYVNLHAYPEAQVQIGWHTITVTARDAGGDYRQHLWARAVKTYRGYAGYQERTRRQIPVVVLEPPAPV